MKKAAQILLGLIICTNTFAQIEKGDFLLQFQGSYTKSPSEVGVTSNSFYTVQNQLSLGGTVEYMIGENFSAGIGLNYLWNKEDRESMMSLGTNSFALLNYEDLKIKQNTFLPQVSLTYHFKIIDRLFINPSLAVAYGIAKSEYDTKILYASTTNSSTTNYTLIDGSSQINTGSITKREETDAELFAVSLSPTLSYFFSKKFGLNLSLGSVEYGLVDWETKQSIIVADFTPKYWRFGISFIM